MPRVNGVYQIPPGTYGVPNTTIESAKYNAFVDDIAADANAPRPVTAGGTGSATAVGGNDNLNTVSTNIAAAATTNLANATGVLVNVTGAATITSFGTVSSGSERVLVFTGASTLTYNATSLILPGNADIVTAAGDTALMRSLGSGNWRCISYQRRSGAGVDVITSVDNTVPRFDGTAGKLQTSGVTISDADAISGAASLAISSAGPVITLTDTDTGASSQINANSASGSLTISADTGNAVANSIILFSIDGSESARLTSSGAFSAVASVAAPVVTTPTLNNSGAIMMTPASAVYRLDSNAFRSEVDNSQALGASTLRWANVWTTNISNTGTITISAGASNYFVANGVIRSDTDNFAQLGASTFRWSNVFSVNGDFSSTVTAGQVFQSTNINAILAGGTAGSVILRPNGSGSTTNQLVVSTTTATIGGTAIVLADRTITAGNGMTGGGTLGADRTLTLGTPSSITNSTTNSVTTNSHTHALGFMAAEVMTNGDSSTSSYPLGHIVFASGTYPDRTGAATVRLSATLAEYSTTTGTALAGTWRSRGAMTISGNTAAVYQRVA